jgi:hypothetical protein
MIIPNNMYPKSRAYDNFPNPKDETSQTTWRCLRLARPTQTTSTRVIGCMKGSMALLWINRWIGHVTQTKHRDTRLEYRASESKNVKWVERKGLAWKDGRRTPEELVVAHITTKRPIREEANHYNKQRMQHLLLRQKIRHDHVKHVWHGNYDAMQLIKIKRNRDSDTHIYGSS